jgi:hypothetical protein
MATPLTEQARSPFDTTPAGSPRMATSPAVRKRIATKVDEIPDRQLACRAGRHKWPLDELEVGKKAPKGLEISPSPSGYQLDDVCTRCGKTRTFTTHGNILDDTTDRRYKDPKDWVKLDRDLEVTKNKLRAALIIRSGLLPS